MANDHKNLNEKTKTSISGMVTKQSNVTLNTDNTATAISNHTTSNLHRQQTFMIILLSKTCH